MWNTIKYFRRKNLLVYVTNKCNHQCCHCFYLNKINTSSDALTIKNIEKVISHFPKFRLLSFTGGEPFLRDDLKELSFLFVDHLDVEELEVNTNGSFPERIRSFSEEYMKRYKHRRLLIQLSLLGPPHIHDSITGVADSFRRLNESVRYIGSLRCKYTNMDIYFCVPIMRKNFKEIPFFFNYAHKNHIMIKFSPLKSSTKTIHLSKPDLINQDFVVEDENLFLDHKEYDKFIANIERENKKYKDCLWSKKDRLRNYAYVFVTKGKSLGECRFRKKNRVIFSNGDYSICEFLRPVGNIFEDNGNFEAANEKVNKVINETRNCFCGHGSYLFKNMKLRSKYANTLHK